MGKNKLSPDDNSKIREREKKKERKKEKKMQKQSRKKTKSLFLNLERFLSSQKNVK